MAFDATIRIAAAGAEAAARDLDKVGTSVEGLGARTQQLSSAWGGLAATIGGALGVRELLQMADAATTLRNRLELVTGSTFKAAQAYEELFRVAQSSRSSFTELGATYATMARAGQQLGLTQQTLLTVTEAIGNAMAISGGSAQSMQAALVQLGQGMAAGVLRGEELNSVMEQAPRLAQALADGLGVSVGELRKLGEAGAITSERVIGALTKAAPQLADEVRNASITFGQAMTVLNNSSTRLVGQLDQATGASRLVASALQGIAGAMDLVANTVKQNQTAFAILGGGLLGTGAVLGAVAAWTALKGAIVLLAPAAAAVAAAMGPVVVTIGAIAAGIGAAVAAVNAFRNSRQGLDNRIEFLSQGDSIRGPRGQERLEELRRLQAQRALLQLDGVDTSAEDRRLGALGVAEAQRIKDTKELLDVRLKLANVDGNYISTVQRLAEIQAAGNLPVAEYVKLVQELASSQKGAQQATRESEEAQERQRALLADLSGYTKDYRREVADIQALRARGLVDERTYALLLQDLVAKQPIVAKALKEQAEAIAARNKAMMDAEADVDAYLDAQLRAQGQAADAAEAALKTAQEEYANFGKLKSQIAETTLLRLKDALAAETLGTTAYASIYRQIEAQQKLVEVLRQGEMRDASIKQMEATRSAWQNLADDIGRALTDSLFRAFESGKGFFDTLLSSIKSLLKTTVLKVLVQPVQYGMNQFLAGLMGQQQPGAAGGIFGNLSQLGSLYGMGSRVGGQVGSWFGSSTGGGAVGNYLTTGGVEGSIVGGGTGGGAGAVGGSAFSAIWPLAAVAGFFKAQQDYKEGFGSSQAIKAQNQVFGGNFGQWSTEGAMANLLSSLGLSDKWASLLSGSTAVAKIIGRADPRVTDQGLSGTLGGAAGANLQSFQDWFSKGGLLRRNKSGTNYGQLDSGMASAFIGQAKGLQDAATEYGKILGLPTEALANVTTQMRVSITGRAEEDAKAVADAFKKYQDDLFNTFGDAVKPWRKFGEEVADTVKRLANLQSFSEGLNTLGGIFSRVALLGVDAREGLIALAGGMDQLKQQAASFVQQYYNRDEIAGIKAREVQQALAGVGITQDIGTKDQFRTLVESLDVSTELGRKQLATLLGVSDSFANVADYLAEAGGTLSGAAALAPASGTLGALFQTASTDQVSATNQVRDAVQAMHQDLADLIRNGQAGGGFNQAGGRGWNEPQEVVSLP